MTPGCFDANSNVFSSWIGSASMSARSAIVGPGRPPRSRATTLVGVGRSGSSPQRRSFHSTKRAVSCSSYDSSGRSWMWRRQPMISGSSSGSSDEDVLGSHRSILNGRNSGTSRSSMTSGARAAPVEGAERHSHHPVAGSDEEAVAPRNRADQRQPVGGAGEALPTPAGERRSPVAQVPAGGAGDGAEPAGFCSRFIPASSSVPASRTPALYGLYPTFASPR
jgi:hypothetical protein